MERTIEIIKALLQLIAQGTFTNDIEGARKITIVVQTAAEEVERLEASISQEASTPCEEVTHE